MKLSYAARSVLSWVFLLPLVLLTLFPYAVMLTTALKRARHVALLPYAPQHLRP